MLIIKEQPYENGAHANQSGSIHIIPDGWLVVPQELEAEAASYLPYIKLTVKKGIITAVAQGEKPPADIEPLRSAKLAEISAAAEAAVYAGCTVQLPSTGEDEHFSLTLKDQIDLSAAFTAVTNGAPYYPYHSDTLLCRLYPAEDIMVMGKAATAHVLYHTTYCNHLNTWIRRAETEEELEAIFYGAELPADLAENLGEVLQFAQSM